jgi:hypothetical protein
MIAPSGYEAPTASRIWDDSVSSRVFRKPTFLTTLASMSRANESNFPPLGVWKRMAASERRRSFFGAANDGRY